jgi:membrane protein DedA with SNARE-associated domain
MERIYRFFRRYGAWTAFMARFAAGLRAPTFLLAGTARMSFRTFILADGGAALISVPLLVWLAFHFGNQIDRVKEWLMSAKYVVALALVIIVAVWIAKRIRAHMRARGAAAKGGDRAAQI